jgi:histidine triad (HIT) family protein
MEDCIFCKIAKGEIPADKIYENDNFFSMLDQNQSHKGHTLVISKNHFDTALELPSTLGGELVDCIKKTTFKVMKDYEAEGFNLISNNFETAGQVVNHFHMHIFPRKKGDGVRVYE